MLFFLKIVVADNFKIATSGLRHAEVQNTALVVYNTHRGGGGGGGVTLGNIEQGCMARRFPKPYLLPKSAIFPTLFMTRPNQDPASDLRYN